jgi:RimJ/RimL family protein N-acetyltransferase
MQFDNYAIRQLTEEDTLNYFKLIENNRPRLEDFFAGAVSRTKTIEDTRQFVIEKISAKTHLPFVIVDKSCDKIIGYIDIKSIEWYIPKGELGCFVDKEYANLGISTKAVAQITDYCFKVLKFHKCF